MPADFCVIDNFIGSSFMLPVALGGVGQEQLNNNFPPPKNLGEAQAGGPRRKALRTSYGASKKENFCLPRSILSEAKDCYGTHLLKRLVLASAGKQNRKIFVSLIPLNNLLRKLKSKILFHGVKIIWLWKNIKPKENLTSRPSLMAK